MMNRWKAAGIHLLISIFVVGAVLIILLNTWYPPAIMGISKTDKLIYLLVGVDIVIGPLLTMIVYKAAKPSLKFDISVIGFLQIGALAFGLYTVWQSRPVFMVATSDRFYLVYANEIAPEDLAQSKDPSFSKLGTRGAVLVAATAPFNINQPISFKQIPDIQNQPGFYIPYEDYSDRLLEQALRIKADSSNETPKMVSVAIEQWAAANKQDLASLRYVPINSSRGSGIMVMSITNKKMLAPINVNPWGVDNPLK